MSKVSGSYPSLSRGVNQQPFEARLDGQHGEQVNLWSDPVHGLSRRRGTTKMASIVNNINGPSYHELNEEQQKELREFYAAYRTQSYITDGLELQVHYPTKPMPAWMKPDNVGGMGGVRITRKIQGVNGTAPGAAIEDPYLGLSTDSQYAITKAAVDKGISTACQVGRYFMLYPNETPFTVQAPVEQWDTVGNNEQIALEVKVGIPSRVYAVRCKIDGVEKAYQYETPSSSYSGTLDTSDIAYSDLEYQKKVNDRVNAYNSAATAWITTAAYQTRPSQIIWNILQAMQEDIYAVGGTLFTYPPSGFMLVSLGGTRLSNFVTTDGGNNESFIVTERIVKDTASLGGYHANGHIVQIKPDRGTGSFYVKAITEGGVPAGRVRWEETARTYQPAIVNPFLIIAVKNPATSGKPRIGISTASSFGIAHLSDIIGDTSILSIPKFNGRRVGDEDSDPTPNFFNNQITWAGMFQDRFCVAAGNTISMSEVGNYFNFFRTQTLTVPDSDPVSIFALGSEADTLRQGVIFDRSLLLFGNNQQYSIDGRNPVTPRTSTIIQSSAIEDAVTCPPVSGASFVFFGKKREDSSEIFQMEVGDVADTSNFTGLGMQLSDYLKGAPSQIVYVASPSTLFIRTSESPHSVYVFRFIDQNRQRLMDSWSRFDYHPAFGLIYGMFYHDDAVYFRVAREAWKDSDGIVYRGGNGVYGFDVLERQSLLPQVTGLPYLDSLRPAADLFSAPDGKDFANTHYPFLASVFSRDKLSGSASSTKFQYWLHGVEPNVYSQAEFDAVFYDIPTRDINYCGTGIKFDSYVELTSPIRKDQTGQPILQGRLTISKLDVYYKDTGGFEATVSSNYGIAEQYTNFNGRILGQAANMVGVIPVTAGATPVFVHREVKDYVCKLSARSWMPMSITRVTWTGQWFMNHRAV